MKKRPEITEQTKQNLLDAFWSLYCENRIEKVTIKDITNKAGYNRGTFYEYFEDVYDVLEHIENSLIPTLDELPPVFTPNITLGMPLEQFFELYKQNSKYYSVLLGEKGDPSFAGKLKNTIKPIIMQVFEDMPNVDKRELDYILEYTLSAMIGIMSYWFTQEDAIPNDKLHELIKRLTEQGIMKQLPL
ncbi:TetR/AcrR family transcriptional regulator [Clostridium sp. YIM B02515]|uniref:TetR/AcrR family transcriptional regulator n=1 Tax=Clostridium rhizosphaerae TaxID=2803861 RepID=A0ABS1T5E6_9CLOT|nr:TetR/AcrR family transcriptional regulator [Clostridium rhizosphaerae]MBL4934558.1 TetR/AcrR family transcriptional regulator [Clostridium rhizosphaerae]